jgi:hypothetical protein
MKLLDIVLLSFAVALFMIGVHQSTIYGIKNSYWIFMISLVCILFLRYRRAVAKVEIEATENTDNLTPIIKEVKKKNRRKKRSQKN